MAYDFARAPDADTAVIAKDFRRDERFAVLAGGAALGVATGVGAAFALGRTGSWPLFVAAPVFMLAAYLAIATFRDAIERRAIGCSIAAGLVALSLLAWPVAAIVFPISTLQFWIAPAATLGSMALLASCWNGTQSAMYRLSGEAASVCAIVGFLGLTHLLG